MSCCSGKADHLMKEIPTIVVEKLSEEIIRVSPLLIAASP